MVLQFVPFKLPPIVQQVLPWRWLIVAGLALILFLFLVLQGFMGYGVENAIRNHANKELAAELKDAPDARIKHVIQVRQAAEVATLHRTTYYCATWWLTLIAVLGAGAMVWFEKRKHAPLPRMDVQV